MRLAVLGVWMLAGCGLEPAAELSRTAESPLSSEPVVDQMRLRPLAFTRHGRCRMACRHIDEAEVRAILMSDGVFKPERSRDNGECPSHALEGRTGDGQQVRIVYAACADETRVVTVIDLDTEWPCGDCS